MSFWQKVKCFFGFHKIKTHEKTLIPWSRGSYETVLRQRRCEYCDYVSSTRIIGEDGVFERIYP